MTNESSSPTNVGSNEQLGVGANWQRDPYRLDFVLMPLVKMLAEQELSWSQREQVAHAMLASMRHHKSMTDEMQMHCASTQQQCEGMTIAAELTGLGEMMREQRRSRITPAPHA